jgi:hypothetical protein
MMSLEWSFSPNTQFVIGQHFTDHAFLPRTNHSRRAYSGRFSQPGHLGMILSEFLTMNTQFVMLVSALPTTYFLNEKTIRAYSEF